MMARWLHLAAFLASASAIRMPETVKDVDSCELDPVLVPFQYELKIDPDYPSMRFAGEVIITGRVRRSTDLLLLDSGVDITKAELMGPYDLRSEAKFTTEDGILELEFNHMLEPDIEYRLFLEFTGRIRSSRGIFGDNYTAPDGQQSYFIATEMQPNYASEAYPCVDRPAYKAHFILNVSRPHHLVALSNMPRLSSRQDAETEDKVWDSFEKTPLMSTYTFGFVIANLVPCLPEPGDDYQPDGFNNTVWFLRGHESLGWFAAKWSPIYMKQLEDFTGIKYGLPKMDHVALPYLVSMAMENWGLITYKQEVIELDPTGHTARSEYGLIWLLAHEIIHQWFGNLVTCSTWAYTWLNEGVTSFLHFLLPGKVFGEWDMMGLMMTEEVLRVMDDDGFGPVSLTKDNCTTNRDTFTLTSYYKGAALMRMVYFLLGEDRVKQALRNYLKANEYGCVDQDDLWIHFDEEARKDPLLLPENTTIGEIMNTWTNNLGFPYVTVTRDQDHILLQQELMVFFETEEDRVPAQYWWIPLSYTTSSERNFTFLKPRLWMKPEDAVTKLDLRLDKHDWIIFNLEQLGYYRTLYDNDTWTALTRQLQIDHEIIPPLTRAKLVDDVFALAFFKKLDYSIPLALSKYLARETHYYPWSGAITALENIRFYLRRTDFNQKFEMYLLKLVERAYESSSNSAYDSNYRDTNSRLLNDKILPFACSLGHKACEKRAIDLTQRLLNNDTHFIRKHMDEVHPLMCTMVRLGGQEIWDLAFDMFKAEKTYKLKEDLMAALQCATDEAVWKRLVRNHLNGADGYNSVELFASRIYNNQIFCYVLEEIEQILQESPERFDNILPSLHSLSEISMPDNCRQKFIEVLMKSANMTDEEAERLKSRSEPRKPWIRLQEIEDWFDEESNTIDKVSDDSHLDNEENYLKKPRSSFNGMDDTFDMYHYPKSPYDYDYENKAEEQGKSKPKGASSSSSSSAASDFNLFILILSVLPSPIYLTYILFAPFM